MFPSKSMMDYMTEFNRLFPTASENEMLQTSPFSQSTMANRSSSSDSTSPESFPDFSLPFAQRVTRPNTSRSIFSDHIPILNSPIPQDFAMRPTNDYDIKLFDLEPMNDIEMRPTYSTPKLSRDTSLFFDYRIPKQDIAGSAETFMTRSYPTVGRKILGNPDNFRELEPPTKVAKYEHDIDNATTPWQSEKPLMFFEHERAPNMNNYFIENNDFYELFPTENKGYEYKTPTKGPGRSSLSPNPSNASPNMYNASPNMSNASSNMSNVSPNSLAPCSPILPNFSPILPNPTLFYPRQPSIYGPSSSNLNIGSTKICAFCRKNGETPMVYTTHAVKQKIGNKQIVTCPILRSHVCSTCGASGDYAHTITYCPVLRNNNRGQPLESTTITLKNTRIKSNGRRRY